MFALTHTSLGAAIPCTRAAFFAVGLPGVAMALVVRFTVRELPRGWREQQALNVRPYSLQEVGRFFRTLSTGRWLSLAAALQSFAAYSGGTWGQCSLSACIT